MNLRGPGVDLLVLLALPARSSFFIGLWMALLNGPFPRKMNTKRSSSRSFQWWYCRKSLSLNRRRCSIINSHTKAAAALSPVRPKTNAQVTPRDTERENIFGTKLLTLALHTMTKLNILSKNTFNIFGTFMNENLDFFDLKTPQKTLIRVTYFLHIRVGWLLQI